MERSFPRNLDEFQGLLKEFGCSQPSDFLEEEFSDTNVAAFLFLWTMWQELEDPNESSYSNEKVAFLKQRAREQPSTADPRLPIIEKMLNAGVSPQEISKLVCLEQERFAQFMCYHLDDPTSHIPWSIGEDFSIQLCLASEEHGANPEKPIWALSDLFQSAKPMNGDQ